MNLNRTVKLNNGLEIPIIGLGTYRMTNKKKTKQNVKQAIEVGYRHIDTATVYKNESEIGEALQEIFSDPNSGILRKDIWVTSKLSPSDQGYEKTLAAVEASLKKLKFDYIDMYLIHWPGAGGLKVSDPLNLEKRKQSWKALEELYAAGKIRAIGVSNYQINHLEEMKAYATVMPAVNQCEFHPLLYTKDLVEYNKKNGIAFEAYSSLVEGRLVNGTYEFQFVENIVKNHEITHAQLYLAWALHQGVIVIPKASSLQRLKENLGALDVKLDEEEFNTIISNTSENQERFCWDPTTVL
ncbi:hypothetical protein BB559_004363 [Furculomyces boomerangus]|uniref:NADP-dependent oxidoreductase domain-containing protein n=1 Tax=Furculomyces boomerangus TaxID=61424 RepID=A0A2T9YF33_9FUNG|nr:hypothetical protein BB559_004363 [Furculomyces boomerangus]